MKFSILTSLLAIAVGVRSEEYVESEPELVIDPNFVPTAEKPFNIQIDSLVSFKEHDSIIDDIYNGETVELKYTLTSYEPELLTVVGVGGELLDPVTGYVAANITSSRIGPIEIPNNQTAVFAQKVGIQLTPGSYVLSPAIYVVYDDQFMMLTTATKLVNITDQRISIFNPKLIIAELLLGGTIFAIVYTLYTNFASTYLLGILPPSLLPVDKKTSAKAAKKERVSASASASASDMEQWLPDSYKTVNRKSKKRA